jgi:hypothetical protein
LWAEYIVVNSIKDRHIIVLPVPKPSAMMPPCIARRSYAGSVRFLVVLTDGILPNCWAIIFRVMIYILCRRPPELCLLEV